MLNRKTKIKLVAGSLISILAIIQFQIRDKLGGTPYCVNNSCPAIYGIDARLFDWGVLLSYLLLVAIIIITSVAFYYKENDKPVKKARVNFQ